MKSETISAVKKCEICGLEFVGHIARKVCSDACAKKRQLKYRKDRGATPRPENLPPYKTSMYTVVYDPEETFKKGAQFCSYEFDFMVMNQSIVPGTKIEDTNGKRYVAKRDGKRIYLEVAE